MADSKGLSAPLTIALLGAVVVGSVILLEQLHQGNATTREAARRDHERELAWVAQAGRSRTAWDLRRVARLLEASPPPEGETGEAWRSQARVFHREAQAMANAASTQAERDMALEAVSTFSGVLGDLTARKGDAVDDPWSLPTWEAQGWRDLNVQSAAPQACVELPLGEGSIELRGHYWIEAPVPGRRDRRPGAPGIVIKIESDDGPGSYAAKAEGEHLKFRGNRACVQLLDNSPGDNAQADPPLQYQYWVKQPEPSDAD